MRTLTIMGFPSQTWPGACSTISTGSPFPSLVNARHCLDKTDGRAALKIRRHGSPSQVDHGILRR